MKIPQMDDEELGRCCADFYSHPLVVKLLDGIFHPGGLALSNLMAEKMSIRPNARVLDIACGDGMTATFFAKKWKCHVSGIDAGAELIQRANQRAKDLGVEGSTAFQVGFATDIPFPDAEFDSAYSECAVCTFSDKDKSVQETARVLKSRGILGINDIIIHDHDVLDEELQGLIGQVACVAGALSPDGYRLLFETGGFQMVEFSDHSDLLAQMVTKAAGRARVMTHLDETLSETASSEDILRVIQKIQDQVDSGNLGYYLFIFKKFE